MLVTQSIDIVASAEQVWDVIAGNEFANISKWCIGIVHSEGITKEATSSLGIDNDDKGRSQIQIPSNGYIGRKVTAPNGNTITSTLIDYSNEQHSFQYQAEPGSLPSFITLSQTTWKVQPTDKDKDQCTFTLELSMTMKVLPGLILEPIFTYFVCPSYLQGMCQSLKYYVENGQPTPDKTQEVERYTSNK